VLDTGNDNPTVYSDGRLQIANLSTFDARQVIPIKPTRQSDTATLNLND
jgi:hypothetical protein